MPNLKNLALVFCLILTINNTNAQLGFSHEIGIIAGPVEFRSDFGQRNDSGTNFGNSGFGIGLVHYLNFSYRGDCNCYTTDNFFNDHFKVRSELSWNRTNLQHIGEWVDASRTSTEADQLRSHTGVANNIDIGVQLEFFPFSLRSFQAYGYRIAPFASLGVHYTAYTPQVSTTFGDGDALDASNFYSLWDVGSVDASAGTTWSLVSSVGARYKLTRFSDLMLDFRWQYYFDDWVDGLNHQLDSNKNNDWLVWLNVGFIYYLD